MAETNNIMSSTDGDQLSKLVSEDDGSSVDQPFIPSNATTVESEDTQPEEDFHQNISQPSDSLENLAASSEILNDALKLESSNITQGDKDESDIVQGDVAHNIVDMSTSDTLNNDESIVDQPLVPNDDTTVISELQQHSQQNPGKTSGIQENLEPLTELFDKTSKMETIDTNQMDKNQSETVHDGDDVNIIANKIIHETWDSDEKTFEENVELVNQDKSVNSTGSLSETDTIIQPPNDDNSDAVLINTDPQLEYESCEALVTDISSHNSDNEDSVSRKHPLLQLGDSKETFSYESTENSSVCDEEFDQKHDGSQESISISKDGDASQSNDTQSAIIDSKALEQDIEISLDRDVIHSVEDQVNGNITEEMNISQSSQNNTNENLPNSQSKPSVQQQDIPEEFVSNSPCNETDKYSEVIPPQEIVDDVQDNKCSESKEIRLPVENQEYDSHKTPIPQVPDLDIEQEIKLDDILTVTDGVQDSHQPTTTSANDNCLDISPGTESASNLEHAQMPAVESETSDALDINSAKTQFVTEIESSFPQTPNKAENCSTETTAVNNIDFIEKHDELGMQHVETSSVGKSIIRDIEDTSIALTNEKNGDDDLNNETIQSGCSMTKSDTTTDASSDSEVPKEPITKDRKHSDVSIMMDTVQRHLTLNSAPDTTETTKLIARNQVSLFDELVLTNQTIAEGEKEDLENTDILKLDDSEALLESDLENVDDAVAMIGEHIELVAQNKVTTPDIMKSFVSNPIETQSLSGSTDLNHSTDSSIRLYKGTLDELHFKVDEMSEPDHLLASNNSLFASANENIFSNVRFSDNAEREFQSDQSLNETIEQTVREALDDDFLFPPVCQGQLLGPVSSVGILSEKTFDGAVSDVVSEPRTPRSNLTMESGASDELLLLLERIGSAGSGIRTELEKAYARETVTQKQENASDVIIKNQDQEIKELRSENEKIGEQLAYYKACSKQSSQKVQKLEGLVHKLHDHIEDIERGMGEERIRQQLRISNMKSTGIATESVALCSVGIQVVPDYDLVMDSQQFNDGLSAAHLEDSTKTSTPSKSYRPSLSTGQFLSPVPIQGTVELEGETKRKIPSRVTDMIDKMLNQMTHLNASADASLNSSTLSESHIDDVIEDSEPEGPDKWRRLAMVPVTSDPRYLTLQRSLATASFENELLQSKVKKGDKELSRKIDRLVRDLEESSELLRKEQEEKELLKVKLHGDEAETDLLQDKITSLEKSLSLAQTENCHLVARLEEEEATRSSNRDTRNELDTKVTLLEEEKTALEEKLAQVEDINKALEQSLVNLREESSTNKAQGNELNLRLSETSSEKNVLQAELNVIQEEYDYLRKGMDLLQGLFPTESNNLIQTGDSLIPSSVTTGGSISILRELQTHSENETIPAQRTDSKSVDQFVESERATVSVNDGDQVIADLSRSVFRDSSIKEAIESSDHSEMAFPIYPEQIEELKRHVFGWQQLQYGRIGSIPSAPSPSTAPTFSFPHQVPLQSVAMPYTIPVTNSVSQNDGSNFTMLTNSPNTPLPSMYVPSVTHAGPYPNQAVNSTGVPNLHDNIMKQSEMVLNIIKESGGIKEEQTPSTVFHWQDVRNSIAQDLLNESQQKIEDSSEKMLDTVKDLSTVAEKNKGDSLMNLLRAVDNQLTKEEEEKQKKQNAKSESPKDKSVKQPDNFANLVKSLEDETGGAISIIVQSKDGKQTALPLDSTPSSKSENKSRILHSTAMEEEPLRSPEEMAKRKAAYKEQYEKVNAEYEDLRKKRLALLVQAYTGKEDPRNPNDPLTSKALQLARSHSSKGNFDSGSVTPDDFRTKFFNSQNRLQKDLLALSQEDHCQSFENKQSTIPFSTSSKESDHRSSPLNKALASPASLPSSYSEYLTKRSHSEPRENDAISSSLNRTISAISQDSQLIKARIRAMREQLIQAEKKRYSAPPPLDPGSEAYPEDDVELVTDEVEEDEESYEKFRSPLKHTRAVNRLKLQLQESISPISNRKSLPAEPKREIYPHKKDYESPSMFDKRQMQEKKETQWVIQELADLDRSMSLLEEKQNIHAPDDLDSVEYLAVPTKPRILNKFGGHSRSLSRESSHEEGSHHKRSRSREDDNHHYGRNSVRDESPKSKGYAASDHTRASSPSNFDAVRKYRASLKSKYNDTRKGDYEDDLNASTTSSTYELGGYVYVGAGRDRTPSSERTDRESPSHADKEARNQEIERRSLDHAYERDHKYSPVTWDQLKNRSSPGHKNFEHSHLKNSSRVNGSLLNNPSFSNTPIESERMGDHSSLTNKKDTRYSHTDGLPMNQANVRNSYGDEYKSLPETLSLNLTPPRKTQLQKEHPTVYSRASERDYYDRTPMNERSADSPRDKSAALSDRPKSSGRRNNLEESVQSVDSLECTNFEDLRSRSVSPDSKELFRDNYEQKPSIEVHAPSSTFNTTKYSTYKQDNGISQVTKPTIDNYDIYKRNSPAFKPPLTPYNTGTPPQKDWSSTSTKDLALPNDHNLGSAYMNGELNSELRNPDDDAASVSTVTSDADFVVMKSGDILKRPRSTSPLNSHKTKTTPFLPNPNSQNQTDNQGRTSDKFNKDVDYTGIKKGYDNYFGLTKHESLLDLTGSDSKKETSWSEPKRHFGLRQSQGKSVRWAEPSLSSSLPLDNNVGRVRDGLVYNGGILKPAVDPSPGTDIQASNRNESQSGKTENEHISRSSHPPNEQNPDPTIQPNESKPQLTEKQREYANDLIHRYTLELQQKIDDQNPEEPHINKSNAETSPHNGQCVDEFNINELSADDRKKFVDDIINKYSQAWSEREDREITELMAKTERTQQDGTECSSNNVVGRVGFDENQVQAAS